jgi:hypothetical protein
VNRLFRFQPTIQNRQGCSISSIAAGFQRQQDHGGTAGNIHGKQLSNRTGRIV